MSAVETIKLELKNLEEAQVLINLLNIAVKATGLEAAESAIYFTKLIQEACKPKEEDKNNE